MQFDEGERGFSFQKEGPLDMRMDQSTKLSAKEVVNEFSEKQLGKIFKELGEEQLWRRGARAIIEARQKKSIETTTELSDILSKSLPRKKKIHPATQIFQALRIFVNKELEIIEGTLKKAIRALAPEGRVGVISFHSLEDRIVKNVLREASLPIRDMMGKKVAPPEMELMTKKPICPPKNEKNRRARSAKYRVAKKL